MVGIALLALNACSSDKGPGAIGSKDDIVVRNNGMPQAAQAEVSPVPAGADFTSTTEQAAAIPPPEVAPAESLPEPAQEQDVSAVPAAAPSSVYPPADYPAEVKDEQNPAAPEIAPAAAPPTPVDLKDPAIIRSAQAALKLKAGYNGPEDGEIGTAFLNALSSYQGKNSLPQGGLNEETLRSLGVIE